MSFTTEYNYKDYIHEVLNVTFNLALTEDYVLGSQENQIVVDFGDKANRVFVELIEYENARQRNEIIEHIYEVNNAIVKHFNHPNIAKKLILVFLQKIRQEDRLFFDRTFKNGGTTEYRIYDYQDIIKFGGGKNVNLTNFEVDLKKVAQTAAEKEIEKNKTEQGKGVQGESQQGDVEVKEIKSNPKSTYSEIINSFKGQIYSVGSYWSGIGDQSERFLKKSIWENGPDGKLAYQVNKINPGDILILKSTYREGGVGVFRVKAFGKVISNKRNGKDVGVEWKQVQPIIIPGTLSRLRHRINTLQKGDSIEIFNRYDKEELNGFTLFNDPISEQDQYDKIPFHLDNVECEDKLNREPVAKSLARLINEDIFSQDSNHAFMVHLQGAWGAGKSTFLNLLESNLPNSKNKWVVVKYNAWQNQHISPPWWSMIDQVYKQGRSKLTSYWSRSLLFVKEYARRFRSYGGGQKLTHFILSIGLILLMIYFGDALTDIASNMWRGKSHVDETKGFSLEVFAKLFTTAAAGVGLIYSISKFVTKPFFLRNAGEAKSFVERARDPMKTIENHFNDLIHNYNKAGYQVAIYIDDLDRCNREYTIQLLEGIQTLFKNKRVLYVVAGDKDWISTCFEENYKEFNKALPKSSQKLGELFLEKAFQLSIRMPQISAQTKEKYWHYIIGQKETISKEIVSDETIKEVKKEIRELRTSGSLKNSAALNELETKYKIEENVMSDIALEVLDENGTDFKHLLLDHHKLVEPNPRAIKRLANEYTMYRNTLWAERRNFDNNILFRWLILENRFPVVASWIKQNLEKLDDNGVLGKEIGKFDGYERLEQLIIDKNDLHGGKMTSIAIADILGIEITEEK